MSLPGSQATLRAKEFSIGAIPTFILFKDGQQIRKLVAPKSKSLPAEGVDELLK